MVMAELKIPFLEGLKNGAGYTSEYMTSVDYNDGQRLGQRVMEASAKSYELDDLRRQAEAFRTVLVNLNEEVETLKKQMAEMREEIARKDNRWGQF